MNTIKNSTYSQYCLAILIYLFLFSFSGCQRKESEDSFKFVFMTDVHIQTELNADEGFKMAVEKINELNPDFIINGGDLVMDALDESYERSVEQFDLYNKISSEIKTPVYNAIGNHDMFGVYEESGVDATHPEYGKQMYKNRICNGETYYSFDNKNWHFIVLDVISITDDNRYMGLVDSVQIEWIKNDLEKIGKETPIVIVAHIPLITFAKQILYGYPAELTRSLVVTNSFDILRLFDEYNLKLVLQGHLHTVEEMIFKDVHFITGGAISGKWWKGANHGFEEGFILLDVINDDFSWEFINYGWNSTYIDSVAID